MGFCKQSLSLDFLHRHYGAALVGPTVYFHPAKGDRVFVTVSEDGGAITSLTPMTPELEKGIRETPDKIRYGISRAYVGE